MEVLKIKLTNGVLLEIEKVGNMPNLHDAKDSLEWSLNQLGLTGHDPKIKLIVDETILEFYVSNIVWVGIGEETKK